MKGSFNLNAKKTSKLELPFKGNPNKVTLKLTTFDFESSDELKLPVFTRKSSTVKCNDRPPSTAELLSSKKLKLKSKLKLKNAHS